MLLMLALGWVRLPVWTRINRANALGVYNTKHRWLIYVVSAR